ncbi:hypothetical protein [Halobacterium wangiae]|uniref:hypothetical protein n=1 Tax=Halobacterium wangiae TaxID=2902623 RepID=UPI001E6165F9|nr:hypothetical protein [Halobacterium wangiae]
MINAVVVLPACNRRTAVEFQRVYAGGDGGVLTEDAATDGDNDVLVSNVAAFLVTGEKGAGEPPSGGSSGQQPSGFESRSYAAHLAA